MVKKWPFMTLPKLKKKMENEKYVIYAVTFDTIEMYTSLALKMTIRTSVL
jgi:hypothetical protein